MKNTGYTSKYPILLVHGMGFRDRKHLNYWGRIPSLLEENGYKIYYGNQDANGSIENNAKALKKRMEELCLNEGIKKFNVIAHSKGGLDMRYAISKLECGYMVASLTTIGTPHNGSKTIDKLLHFPKIIIRFGCWLTDIFFRLCKDNNPQTYNVINSFKTSCQELFNEEVKDDPNVYYQSYAFIMKKRFSGIIMWLPYSIVKHYEGPNDGFLAPASVKWGNFKGIYQGPSNRGISHADEVDFRRHAFSKRPPTNKNEVSDITLFYLELMNELVINKQF